MFTLLVMSSTTLMFSSTSCNVPAVASARCAARDRRDHQSVLLDVERTSRRIHADVAVGAVGQAAAMLTVLSMSVFSSSMPDSSLKPLLYRFCSEKLPASARPLPSWLSAVKR